MHAGVISRDPDAYCELFTDDGVYEAPFVPDDHPLRRLAGRAQIRAGVAAYYQMPAPAGTVDFEQSAYVLHATDEPDTFIVEIDTVLTDPDSRMSLVQIFRVQDGLILQLRDYFTA
jgi:ketosteroid isomerase-like protein